MRQPPENSRYGRRSSEAAKAETVQNFGGARFRRITAEVVELGVQSRQCSIVAALLRFGDGALDAAQLNIAIQCPVERGTLGRCVSWSRCAMRQRGGIRTSPISGSSRPRSSANRLDLPTPFRPTSAM